MNNAEYLNTTHIFVVQMEVLALRHQDDLVGVDLLPLRGEEVTTGNTMPNIS